MVFAPFRMAYNHIAATQMREHVRRDVTGERPCDVTETAWAPYLMRKCSDSTIT